MAVAVIMVLPGLGGLWLDGWLETSFLALAGFAVGVSAGIWYLIVITRPPPPSNPAQKGAES